MDVEELGRRVLKQRKGLKLSQQALADRAHVSRNYISLIERSLAKNISATIINNLAVALEMTPTELWGQAVDEDVLVTSTLRQFSIEEGLRYDVVDKLARISRPGHEPKSVAEWRAVYEVLRPYVEGEDSTAC